MIAVPPLFVPAFHVNPTLVAEVTDGLLLRFIGALGTKTITAPVPGGEADELP
jgi:hypothetical protein